MTVTSVLADLVRPMSADSVRPVLAGSVSAPPAHGPALVVRRCWPEDGGAYWRWDCRRCGEYGGGGSHPDAMHRALRHCAEHPQHRSSLLPPTRCRERRLSVHPALFQPAEEEILPGPDGD